MKTASTHQERPAEAPAMQGDPPEITKMVRELEARHGLYAASVARFVADFNEQNGRVQQSLSWRRVCDAIEARTLDRLRQAKQPLQIKLRTH